MPAADLKNMDVDALLALRADVESLLAERARDLQRQIALLGGSGRVAGGKRRGRPPGGAGRASAMRGVKVPPKYRGPDGETWAGRGATPRWLSALLKEGHLIEEFAIAQKGGKAAAAAGKKVIAKKKGRKPAVNGRRKGKAAAEAA
jgi:DNA-binding protein H-NS